MGRPRSKLHQLLKTLTSNVYFQPPNGLKMEYPCIVYKRDFATTDHADNESWRHTKRYQVTVIDQNPDSVIPDMVAQLPMCEFNRFYTADNLNHDVYNIFF